MQKSDFRHAASEFEASRDVIAQLYCAMLRAAGLEARLVCSLQVLPLDGTARPESDSSMWKARPAMLVEYADTRAGMGLSDPESGTDNASMHGSESDWKVSRIRSKLASRLGRSALQSQAQSSLAPAPRFPPGKILRPSGGLNQG